MELPPITGTINRERTLPNTNLLSPTSRSPLNRSPSMSPTSEKPRNIFGTAKKPMLGDSGLMGGGFVNLTQSGLLSPVVKAAREEVGQNFQLGNSVEKSRFANRQHSVSVAPDQAKTLFQDQSTEQFTSLQESPSNKPKRHQSAVKGGKNSDANIASRVTLDDMMNSVNKVPLFGLQDYKAPTNEHMFKKPRGGIKGFGVKKHSYIVELTKRKALVPGPGVHQKIETIDERFPKRTGKFSTKDRLSIAGEIMKKKPSPGPSSYQETKAMVDKWKTATSKVGAVPGNYKQTDQIISFVAEYVNVHGDIPLHYKQVELDKIKPKIRQHEINKDIPRFKKLEKDDKPGAGSYNDAEAFKKAKVPNRERNFPSWVNGRGEFKAKTSVFYEQAKRSISPGVAGKNMNYESYKKLSPSPSLKKARH